MVRIRMASASISRRLATVSGIDFRLVQQQQLGFGKQGGQRIGEVVA